MTDTVFDQAIAPVMNQRPLLIGSAAPLFSTRTTMGDRSLDDYRGRWLVFFSHPADFTPVCTSEFVTFSKLYPEFRKLDCDLLALSVDSLFSHIAWVRSIKERFGVSVTFPIPSCRRPFVNSRNRAPRIRRRPAVPVVTDKVSWTGCVVSTGPLGLDRRLSALQPDP